MAKVERWGVIYEQMGSATLEPIFGQGKKDMKSYSLFFAVDNDAVVMRARKY